MVLVEGFHKPLCGVYYAGVVPFTGGCTVQLVCVCGVVIGITQTLSLVSAVHSDTNQCFLHVCG